jgi:hypothetical protein
VDQGLIDSLLGGEAGGAGKPSGTPKKPGGEGRA